MVALIYFHIYDLGKAVCFNLRRGTVEVINRRKSDCDIEVGSQALWYAFKFAWVLARSNGTCSALLARRSLSFWWSKRQEILDRLA